MEAHGHERIGGNVSKFMRELIKLKYPDVYQKMYSKFIENGEHDDAVDPMTHALYLGNWLSDFSQFFATDMFYDLKGSVGEKVENYNQGVNSLFDLLKGEGGRLGDLVKAGLHKALTGEETEGDEEAHVLTETQELKLSDIVQFLIPEESAVQLDNFLNVFIGQLSSQIDKSLDTARQKLLLEGDFLKGLANQPAFVYDNREFMWEVGYLAVRYLGFMKFVKNPEKQMDAGDFDFIVSHFVENIPEGFVMNSAGGTPYSNIGGNTAASAADLDLDSEEERFHFKLSGYYPVDHLDRPFAMKHLEYDRSRAEEDELDGPLTKQSYIDRRLHSPAETGGEKFHIYQYLYDFLDVVATKLTDLNLKWVKNSFVDGNETDSRQTALYAARLGQTLHGVEDFFAHSNFLELLVDNLDMLREGIDPERKILTKKGFEGLLNTNEGERFDLALGKALDHSYYEKKQIKEAEEAKDPKPEPPHNNDEGKEEENTDGKERENESYLVTGFFGDADMKTSMYHLLFGSLEKKLEKAEYAQEILSLGHKLFPKVIGDPDKPDTIDGIIYFYKLIDTLDDYEPGLNDENILGKLMSGNIADGEFFSAEDWQVLFDPRRFRAFISTFPAIDHNMIGGESEALRNLVNGLMKAATLANSIEQTEELFENTVALKQVFKVATTMLSMILFAPFFQFFIAKLASQVESLLIDLLKESLLRVGEAIVDQIIASFMQKLLNMAAEYIEKKLLHFHGPEMAGSHSVIAKDEAFRNKGFNTQAIRCAVFMDQMIVMALFGETKLDGYGDIDMIDMNHFIHKLLAHPLDEQTTEFLTGNNFSPFYSGIPVQHSGVVTCILDDYSIQALYEAARDSSAYSAEEYEVKFLSGNPSIKKHYLTKHFITLRNIYGYRNRKQLGGNQRGTAYKIYIPSTSERLFDTLDLQGFTTNRRTKELSRGFEISAVVSNWAVHFFSEKDLTGDEEYSLEDSIMNEFLDRVATKFGQEADDSIPVDPELENIDSIAGMFGHLEMEEPLFKYIKGSEAKNVRDAGIDQEIAIKQGHEEFMEAFVNFPD